MWILCSPLRNFNLKWFYVWVSLFKRVYRKENSANVIINDLLVQDNNMHVQLWSYRNKHCRDIFFYYTSLEIPYAKALYQSGYYFVRSHCYITRYLRETTNWLLLAIISSVTSLSFSSRHLTPLLILFSTGW